MISLEDVVTVLVRASDYHEVDDGHSARSGTMAVELGVRLGLKGERLRWLKCSAKLHDLGRVGIDHDIMSRQGKLTAGEWGAIHTHPQIGYDIVKGVLPQEVSDGILYHHENWDGTGYPENLRGEAIPLFARIISIVDRWDALRHDRPYREALNFENALHLMNLDARFFDPHIYTLFLDILKEGRAP